MPKTQDQIPIFNADKTFNCHISPERFAKLDAKGKFGLVVKHRKGAVNRAYLAEKVIKCFPTSGNRPARYSKLQQLPSGLSSWTLTRVDGVNGHSPYNLAPEGSRSIFLEVVKSVTVL